MINDFVQKLSSHFLLKDLDYLSYFLGVEVHSTSLGIFLSQQKYITDLLHSANIQNFEELNTNVNRYFS